MSIASSILEQSADALAIGHDDPLTLQPANVVISGYAQELSGGNIEGTPQHMLHIGLDLVTHIVHVRRSLLANVMLSEVASIDSGDKSYRVRRVTDDPNFPEVRFFCTLS